jgi:hypothetical protein
VENRDVNLLPLLLEDRRVDRLSLVESGEGAVGEVLLEKGLIVRGMAKEEADQRSVLWEVLREYFRRARPVPLFA